MAARLCPKCNELKAATDFYKGRGRKCKRCYNQNQYQNDHRAQQRRDERDHLQESLQAALERRDHARESLLAMEAVRAGLQEDNDRLLQERSNWLREKDSWLQERASLQKAAQDAQREMEQTWALFSATTPSAPHLAQQTDEGELQAPQTQHAVNAKKRASGADDDAWLAGWAAAHKTRRLGEPQEQEEEKSNMRLLIQSLRAELHAARNDEQ